MSVVREGANMSWLSQHIETFVKPVIGYSPVPLQVLRPEELIILKNMWRSVKRAAGDRQILLAGRDVWLFEVLARRENYPTIFRPDISRLTVEHVLEDYSEMFLFDTGFVGSIPKALQIKHFLLGSGLNQVFPCLTGSRSLILKIENLPKYWKRGYVRPDPVTGKMVIKQDLWELVEFQKAAAITIAVYTNSAPRFCYKSRPIPRGLW